jgi:hypothetical protein
MAIILLILLSNFISDQFWLSEDLTVGGRVSVT